MSHYCHQAGIDGRFSFRWDEVRDHRSDPLCCCSSTTHTLSCKYRLQASCLPSLRNNHPFYSITEELFASPELLPVCPPACVGGNLSSSQLRLLYVRSFGVAFCLIRLLYKQSSGTVGRERVWFHPTASQVHGIHTHCTDWFTDMSSSWKGHVGGRGSPVQVLDWNQWFGWENLLDHMSSCDPARLGFLLFKLFSNVSYGKDFIIILLLLNNTVIVNLWFLTFLYCLLTYIILLYIYIYCDTIQHQKFLLSIF